MGDGGVLMTKSFLTFPVQCFVPAGMLIVACLPSSASGDPIVLSNRSGANATVRVAEGSLVLAQSSFVAPPAPVSGPFTFSDTAIASGGGASSMVTADLATTFSAALFTARAEVSARVSQDGPADAAAHGSSNAVIDFSLSAPHTYRYTGRFLLETDGEDPAVALTLLAALDLVTGPVEHVRIFVNQFASSAGGVVGPPGVHFVEHAGVLGPGRYVLNAGLASIFSGTTSSFLNREDRLAFDTAFSLAPVSDPIPEPGTLALLATGLIGLAGRAWRCMTA